MTKEQAIENILEHCAQYGPLEQTSRSLTPNFLESSSQQFDSFSWSSLNLRLLLWRCRAQQLYPQKCSYFANEAVVALLPHSDSELYWDNGKRFLHENLPGYSFRNKWILSHCIFIHDVECLVFVPTGMPKEVGPQAVSGCISIEACPEDHQIPAHAQGNYLLLY